MHECTGRYIDRIKIAPIANTSSSGEARRLWGFRLIGQACDDDIEDLCRAEYPAAMLPCQYDQDIVILQFSDDRHRGLMGDTEAGCQLRPGYNWPLEQQINSLEQACGPSLLVREPVSLPEAGETATSSQRVVRLGCHGAEKEGDPAVPVTFRTDLQQPVDVPIAVPIEVLAKIEKRLWEQSPLPEEQGDQQATQTAISVQKGMDSLELIMGDCQANQWRCLLVRLNVPLEIFQQVGKMNRRRRNESCLVDSLHIASDVVLNGPYLTWPLDASAHVRHQDGM